MERGQYPVRHEKRMGTSSQLGSMGLRKGEPTAAAINRGCLPDEESSLAWSQRDSLVILKIACMNAGMSAGRREVMRLPSTTTSRSR
jgi:hypothetical protein